MAKPVLHGQPVLGGQTFKARLSPLASRPSAWRRCGAARPCLAERSGSSRLCSAPSPLSRGGGGQAAPAGD